MEPLLVMKGITKDFGGLRALDKVDMELYPGEVLGLVGDNGAGKSTLIKILTGVFHPTEGEIFLEGKPVKVDSRQQAKELGLEALYQNLALIDSLHAYGNVFLGNEIRKPFLGGMFRFLDNRKMRKEAERVLHERLGIKLYRTDEPVHNLSGGQRQSIAICRAIYREHIKILVLDEPMAALGQAESKRTLDLIRTIRDQGIAQIVISHNLEHIFSACDRIMVLRGGRHVGTRKREETTKQEILGLIIGAEESEVVA